MVVVVICAIIAAAFLVRSSVKTAVLMSNYRSVFIKILFNYFQVIGLIVTSQLQWPGAVNKAFFAHDYSTTFPEHIFSFQCLLDESIGGSFFYLKLLSVALLPYAIITIAYLFWKLTSNLKERRFMFNEFIASILILLFMVHPTFTKVMLSAFDCYEIEGEHWLRQDLNVRCWSKTHVGYALGIGFTSMLIWSVAIPLLVVYRIFHNRDTLDDLSTRLRYGFMYIGYKKKYCYWEYFIILRKVCIILPAVFLSSVSLLLQAIVIHAVLLFSLFLQEICSPFEDKYLNDLEFRAIVVSLVSIYCGMSFLAGGLSDVGRILLMLVFMAVNLYFILYWISAFTQIVGLKLVNTFPNYLKKCMCFPRIRREAQRVLATDSQRSNIVSFNKLCEKRGVDCDSKLKEFSVASLHDFYLIHLDADIERDLSQHSHAEAVEDEEVSQYPHAEAVEDEEVDDFAVRVPSIH